MMSKRFLILVVVALTIAGVVGCGPSKIELGLNLAEGDAHTLSIERNTSTDTEMMGQTMTSTQSVNLRLAFDVQRVEPGGALVMDVTYDAADFTQSGQMGDMSLGAGGADPTAAAFNAVEGESFSMTLSPDGQVRELQGMDRILDKMAENVKLPPQAEAMFPKSALRDMLESQMGAEATREQMKAMFGMYPKEPVAPGDSWTSQTTISQGMPMIADAAYTLESIEGPVATIAMTTAVSPNPAGDVMSMGPMEMCFEVSGEETGTIELDTETGWIRSGSTKGSLSGDMRIKGGMIPGEMSVPVTITYVLRMEGY